MKKFSIIAIIVLSTIASSCIIGAIGLIDYDGAVCIDCENSSDSDLWLSYDEGRNWIDDPVYEVQRYSHESISGDNQSVVFYGKKCFYQVKKNATYNIMIMPTKNGWKWVKKHFYPDSLRIQVWDDALIQKVGWDEFVKKEGEYRYELEYVIDLGYFAKDNWADIIITYPPSGSEDYMRINYP